MNSKSTIFVVQEGITLSSSLVKKLKSVLKNQILVFSDLKEIEKALEYSNPSLLIIDIDFEDYKMRNKVLGLVNFDVPSIVMSKDDNKAFAVGLLKNGAVDYIQKNKAQCFEGLVNSIKEVLVIIDLRLKLKRQKMKQLQNLQNAMIIFACTFILVVVIVSFFKWFH